MNILQINSSSRTVGSHSSRLAADIVERLQATHKESALTLRDLGRNPHPALDEAALQALFTPADQRSPARTPAWRKTTHSSPKPRPPTCWCWACRCTTSACPPR